METNDGLGELGELAARYADLLGGEAQEAQEAQTDHDLIETVRGLDALYAAPVPARVAIPMNLPAFRRGTIEQVGATPTLSASAPRREAHTMRSIRIRTGGRARRWAGIASAAAACLVVGLLAALLIGGHGGGTTPITGTGQPSGLRITAVVDCPQASCSLARAFPSESSVLNHRFAAGVNATSVSVRQTSDTELTIELQGVKDISTVEPLLAQGSFAILDTGQQYLSPGLSVAGQTCTTACAAGQYQIAFTGSQLDPSSISVGMDPQTGQPVLTFAFAGSAQQGFAQYTAQNIGSYLTIALDDVVIESATIQSQIDGSGQITGWESLAQARQAAVLLKSGPLPFPFQFVKVAPISANGAVVCDATPPATPYPASTPTPPPNATPGLPTPTPWPNPTPIPTGPPGATPTQFPPPSGGEPPIILVVQGCGTPTTSTGATP